MFCAEFMDEPGSKDIPEI